MNEKEYQDKLSDITNEIIKSSAPKKLIVSGPGTGKTYLFNTIIDETPGAKNDYLVLTFIKNLVDELKKKLNDKAKIYTLHGYCYFLLLKNNNLGIGIKDGFIYYPPLPKLIKEDWRIITNQENAPEFIKSMRDTKETSDIKFYLERGNYYNAIGYDDSEYRIFQSIKRGNEIYDKKKLLIIDEYQDFNQLENLILSYLINNNPSLVVGDDDQALYCQLRGSDPKFIRDLFKSGDFVKFELPFCLRSTKAVLDIFNKIVKTARENGFLSNRIDKTFAYFPPKKERDSNKYPHIKLIHSTVQMQNNDVVNYFGRYISDSIKNIPIDEIQESYDEGFPTVLIIGPKHYLKSLDPILSREKINYEPVESKEEIKIDLSYGLRLLNQNINSNLGWRIVLENDKNGLGFYKEAIKKSANEAKDLISILPQEFVSKTIGLAKSFSEAEETIEERKINKKLPHVKLTTYEGSKGLSAQHVFILGLQEGLMPKNNKLITDLEICKLLVALSRTRKQCYLMTTNFFCGKREGQSIFLDWIKKDVELVYIDKNFWKTKELFQKTKKEKNEK